VVALLFSPIATELPEIMNAINLDQAGQTPACSIQHQRLDADPGDHSHGAGVALHAVVVRSSLTVAAVVTVVAIAGLLALLRRNNLTPLRLSWFALGYVAFITGILVL